MKITLSFFPFLVFLFCYSVSLAANSYTGQGNRNPLVPGYFADPTIKKFGDTFYLYATTDGVKLASGEPTVWISKDFVNWYNYELDIDLPAGLTNCWAPDVQRAADGKFYYYMGNCQFGCNIYGYVSDNPVGPWAPVNDGKAVIPVGTGQKDLPALDAQFLVDDDGSVYSYFGTWCTSFGGVGWAKINSDDMHTIEESGLIPIAQVPKAFEASYPLKRDGKYFLMYSTGDCRLSSYSVSYSWANSPTGPFTPGANCPILVTNSDGTVDSPGHHSILENNGAYYMIYHRHDNPHSSGGMFRQVCADELTFADSVTIEPVGATHSGVGSLGENQVPYDNLALGATASASSCYQLVSKATKFSGGNVDFEYLPEFATDDNNGTLWKAVSSMLPQSLVVDLGKQVEVKRIMTQFEYATFFYQYKIEVSSDSVNWVLFSDKTDNRRSGSPMIDDNDMDARYIRLTVTGTEKSGLYAAVWNIKAYDSLFEVPSYQNSEVTNETGVVSTGSKLVDLSVNDLPYGTVVKDKPNTGILSGRFIKTGSPVVSWIDSVKAVYFNGSSKLRLSVKAPGSLAWNSSYTASVWAYNPEIGNGECLMVWNSRDNMLMGSYAALMYGTGTFGAVAHGDGYIDLPYKTVPSKGKWHHIAVTFDGMIENVYVDGKLNTQTPMSLFVQNSWINIGESGEPSENFTGYIANAQLFDQALTQDEVDSLMQATCPAKTEGPLSTGSLDNNVKYKVTYDSPDNTINIASFFKEGVMKIARLYNTGGQVVATSYFNGTLHSSIKMDNKGAYILVLNCGKSNYYQKMIIY